MEKRVAPILVIIVLFIALLSTYAWFSDSMTASLILDMESGTPTVVVLGTGTESKTDYDLSKDFSVDPYRGQEGFKSTGEPYDESEADYLYSIDINFPYRAQAPTNVTFYIKLSKVVIELGASYSRSLSEAIADIAAIMNTTAVGEDTRFYSNSVDSYPTGEGASSFYVVWDNTNNKVTHIVIGEAYVTNCFEFDYWKSAESKVVRNGTGYTSAKISGIGLEYEKEVSNAGTQNYVGIYIGFCGYNSTDKIFNKTFAFSSPYYQGSTYMFYLAAEIK